MAPRITLYGFGGTRSARCRWTLLEAGLEFEYVDDRNLIRSEHLTAMQPLGKLPAAVVDGEPLFESAAICTYFSDLAPGTQLIAATGTRERALHDQWTSFVLTELEAYLWSSAKHTGYNEKARQVPEIVPTNTEEALRALGAFNQALGKADYLVGNTFSVTDIIASWTINWARRLGHLDPFPNLSTYLTRLFEREHCTLNRD